MREYEKVARQYAHEGLDHVQLLARLLELELTAPGYGGDKSMRSFDASSSKSASERSAPRNSTNSS